MNVFVIIPYQSPFLELYNEVIKPAVEDVGLTATIANDQPFIGGFVQQIERLITDAEFCLADLTDRNPNVMLEVGWAQKANKPVVLISQGTHDDIPADLRHNKYIKYEQSPEGKESLKREIAKTIRFVLEPKLSDLALLREMIRPKSLELSPFVVAASPLSYREVWRIEGGSDQAWSNRPARTFSDYVGIRGLMRAFGLILGLEALPELVNPDDVHDEAWRETINLYLIGSPMANRWTGLVMEDFFRNRASKWDFRPDPDSEQIRIPKVILRCNQKTYVPDDWPKETSRIMEDFGIVIRGPNPHDSSRMVMVLAGRSALGTEAASFAVTDPGCIRKLKLKLGPDGIDLNDHRQAFLAIVSVKCKGPRKAFETEIDTFCVEQVKVFK